MQINMKTKTWRAFLDALNGMEDVAVISFTKKEITAIATDCSKVMMTRATIPKDEYRIREFDNRDYTFHLGSIPWVYN